MGVWCAIRKIFFVLRVMHSQRCVTSSNVTGIDLQRTTTSLKLYENSKHSATTFGKRPTIVFCSYISRWVQQPTIRCLSLLPEQYRAGNIESYQACFLMHTVHYYFRYSRCGSTASIICSHWSQKVISQLPWVVSAVVVLLQLKEVMELKIRTGKSSSSRPTSQKSSKR